MFKSPGLSEWDERLMDDYCVRNQIDPDNHRMSPTKVADILKAEKRRLKLVPKSEEQAAA